MLSQMTYVLASTQTVFPKAVRDQTTQMELMSGRIDELAWNTHGSGGKSSGSFEMLPEAEMAPKTES